MVAYCGLDCFKCLAYIATRTDDDKLRDDCARLWTGMFKHEIKPEQINCDGCKSEGKHFFICEVCAIRKCAAAKNLDNCALCADYVCEKLENLMKLYPNIRKLMEAQRQKLGK